MKTTKYYAEISYIVNDVNNCPKTVKTDLNTSKVDTIRAGEKLIADIPTYEHLTIAIIKTEVEVRQIFIRFVKDSVNLKSAQFGLNSLRSYLDNNHLQYSSQFEVNKDYAEGTFTNVSDNVATEIFNWIGQGHWNLIGKVEID